MTKKVKLFRIILLLLIAAILFTACRRDEPAPGDDDPAPPSVGDEVPIDLESFTFTPDDFPRMDGSPSTAPLAGAVAAVMLGQSHDDAQLLTRMAFTRTTQAFRNLAGGECDILITGEPAPAVLDEISRQDFRYDMAPIATDALVFIVSLSNPVDDLTSEQVKSIYSGDVTKWQQVGGSNLDIVAFQRNEEALSQVLMEKLVMDWGRIAEAPMQTVPTGFSMYDDLAPVAIRGFDGSENAIGYTTYYYAADMGMADGYKILSIDGIMPTPETIAGGIYPFTNPYYAVVSSDLPEDDGARILYNWLLSDEGQDFINSQGYVSMKDFAEKSGSEPAAPPQMRWRVTTDDSRLTSYSNPRSNCARLYNSALPTLESYDGYGFLLPYSTAVTMNDGSEYAVKYGFVASQSGTIVTDPVYDGISRAVSSGPAGSSPLNAYRLHMNLPEGDPDYGYRTIQAACAGNGSWITPFSYTDIVFRSNVIFMRYGYDTFNIDVYDYDGNLLYNILDLDWADKISENTWPEYLMYGENEDCAFIQLDDGTYALMDVLTGEIRETEFKDAYMFSDSLACVVPAGSGNLWGFVDKNLEIIIPPAYTREAVFVSGRAIVQTSDGAQHIIDNEGNVLFSVEDGFMISSLSDNMGYAVYSLGEAAFPTYLTYDFTQIAYPPDALPLGPESDIIYLRSGWFLCMSENGIWLFSSDGVHALPSSVQNVTDFFGGYISIVEYGSDRESPRYGVMTLDGTVIIEPSVRKPVMFAGTGGGTTWLISNTNTADNFSFDNDYISESYVRAEYSLFGPFTDASDAAPSIKTGPGTLIYDATAGLFYIQGSDYFAWLNHDGEAFISIPSMAYTFD